MFLKRLFPLMLALALPLFAGCKQEFPKTLDEPSVFGTVQSLRQADSQKQLLYQAGQDPYKKNWGMATSYYVTVDGKELPVHWDQVDKYKALKVGDKVNLHPSEFISCVGEADLKPTCHRLMRIYKSERRVNPITTKD
jgi:hypothetical protein